MLFKDIVGQEAVKKRLIQTVSENRISHAQLFLGPEGSGTLPMAIAYAQYIACENKQATDSCGVCPSCLKYQKLAHPDLHFVFPVNTTKSVSKHPLSDKFLSEWREFLADNPYQNLFGWLEFIGIGNKQGNINVEEASEVLRKLSLKSFEAEYKVVIIWMAERMNIPSANKLLKIIEEPPEKTLFLLVAENHEAILTTILSRTQLVKFNGLTDQEISQGLIERLRLPQDKAARIASFSEGSYLNATRLATEDEESHIYENMFIQWMRMCLKKDILKILPWVDDMAGFGRERQKRFLNFGLHVFRESMLMNYGAGDLVRLEGSLLNFTTKFAPFFNEENCLQFTDEFNKAISHIERNANPKILFFDLSVKVIQLILAKPMVKK